MIQANELRIGNYLIDKCFGNTKPTIVDAEWLGKIAEGEHEAIPIPLTPELLEKCGFKKDLSNGNYWKQTPGYLHYLELLITSGIYYPVYAESPIDSNEQEQRVRLPYIQYLHQLQNLYFALTGSELEVVL
jgi:hypothetical protein